METASPRFSVIVPVYNEAAVLPRTVPLLLDGLSPNAELVFVCNQCTDESAQVLRKLTAGRATILDLPVKGKAAAIRAGELAVSAYPRFFVDADIKLHGRDFALLVDALKQDGVQMVSPRMRHNMSGATWAARSIIRTWQKLPVVANGFPQCVIGVSEQGRKNWGDMPDVMADDHFMYCSMPPGSVRIVEAVTQIAETPKTFLANVGVRTRFIKGNRELGRMGFTEPGRSGQKWALLKLLLHPQTMMPAAVYSIHRLLAEILVLLEPASRKHEWYSDHTTRQAGG